jgi:hypothetical protein
MNKGIKNFLKQNNLSTPGDVKWAHAVNSQQLLQQGITNPDIDFLEVDISLSKDGEPIAAHYSNESDLTFVNLLNIVKHSDKGLKLDFKYQDAVTPCLELLKRVDLKQPVILNADILSVAGAPNADIAPEFFINTCLDKYPGGLLSVGWRTTEASIYAKEDVDKILVICKNLDEATFPVRASILPRSWQNVKKLIQKEGYTLTIWNSGPVDAELNSWILKHTSKQNCFYDFTISS